MTRAGIGVVDIMDTGFAAGDAVRQVEYRVGDA